MNFNKKSLLHIFTLVFVFIFIFSIVINNDLKNEILLTNKKMIDDGHIVGNHTPNHLMSGVWNLLIK